MRLVLLLISLGHFPSIDAVLNTDRRPSCYEKCVNYSMPTHDWCYEYARDDLCKTAECWSSCRDLIRPLTFVELELLEEEKEQEGPEFVATKASDDPRSFSQVDSKTLYLVLAFLAIQLNIVVLMIACGVRRCAPDGFAVDIA